VIEEYDLYGDCRFAGDLGGDILECRRLPDGRIFVMIGDVSGHGTASALLMAYVKAVVTLWIQDPDSRLEDLMLQLDRMLRADQVSGRFLAMFACVLDPRTHELAWVSGGHPFPLRRQADQTVTFLGHPCYPLGSRDQACQPQVRRFVVEPGESLWLYTDGLVEALDATGRELGYQALADWVSRHGDAGTASERVKALQRLHDERVYKTDDDVTLLVLCRHRRGPGGDA
ncbi:MAG TPA: PP2C family protein-serine/threonine phosphatase, partial [Candidatus Ozemobacteraceae bacterium]|nr:PP2C family protein-serine/threonine phosphatase [Candidatus Ozemobacteraceae bacterium]